MNDPIHISGASADVTARLREAITRGQLMPNERLIEADLARSYAVNRANIRMALAMLDQEGLVVREPNRGARVRLVSDEEAIEIAETRLAIEGVVARRAAERATDEDKAELQRIFKDMRQAVEKADYPAFSICNAALHREIQRIADNKTANRILQTLKTHLVRLQYRVILIPGRPHKSLLEHRIIVDTICAGDADAAEAAMRQHLQNFKQLLMQSIEDARRGDF